MKSYEYEEFLKAREQNKLDAVCVLQDNGAWMACFKNSDGLISTCYLPDVICDNG